MSGKPYVIAVYVLFATPGLAAQATVWHDFAVDVRVAAKLLCLRMRRAAHAACESR